MLKHILRPLILSPAIARRLLNVLIALHWRISRGIEALREALRKNKGEQYPEQPELPPPKVLNQQQKTELDHPWGKNKGKNVVWFMLDSLRYDVMRGHMSEGGFAGLQEKGLFFDNAFANGSWTYPSVFSFLTGLYPFNIRASKVVDHNGAFVSECDDFDPNTPTIFDRLREHGYEIRSLMDGWELVVGGTADQKFGETYFEERWGQRFPKALYKASPEQLSKMARPHLKELAGMDRPFLLYFRSLSTHFKTGYNGYFKNLSEIEHLCRSGFTSEVYHRLVDSLADVERGLITPVLQHLEKLGLRDDTLVIIHSDHGDMLWNLEPDLQQNSKVGRWNMAAWTHNIEPYQGLIKVPLLISGAGMRGGYSERFRLIDLAPTLLDLLDIPYEKTDFDGCSLRYDGDRSLIYADSANYCELGGISFQNDSSKLICSRRLGSAAYPVLDSGYEKIAARYRAPELVDGLRQFLEQHTRIADTGEAADHEKILIDRLRGLGYL